MENKLILAFYLPLETIEDINENGYEVQVTNYLENVMGSDNIPVIFYLPTNGEPRIECINPVVLNEEQFKEYDEIITDLKNSEQYKQIKDVKSDN